MLAMIFLGGDALCLVLCLFLLLLLFAATLHPHPSATRVHTHTHTHTHTLLWTSTVKKESPCYFSHASGWGQEEHSQARFWRLQDK